MSSTLDDELTGVILSRRYCVSTPPYPHQRIELTVPKGDNTDLKLSKTTYLQNVKQHSGD